MKKNCFTLLLAAMMAVAAKAAPTVDYITVWLTSGEKATYQLDERPQVTCQGEDVCLTTATVEVTWAVADVRRVTFGEGPSERPDDRTTSIDAPTVQGQMSLGQGMVRLEGFTPGEAVRLFNAAGQLTSTLRTDGEGRLSLSASQLGTGLTIIKTNHQSFKINRK